MSHETQDVKSKLPKVIRSNSEFGSKDICIKKLQDICIKKLQVPTSKFPRFEYALENILDLEKRYQNIVQLNGIKHHSEKIVTFYCLNHKVSRTNIFDFFLQDAAIAGKIIKKTKVAFLKNLVQPEENPIVSSLVLPADMEEALSNVGNWITIKLFLAENDREFRAISRRQNDFQKEDTFVIRTSDALEKLIFQSLKTVLEALSEDIEACQIRERNLYVEHKKFRTEKISFKRKPVCSPCEISTSKIKKIGVLKERNSHSPIQGQSYPDRSPTKLDQEQPKVSKILSINKEMLLRLSTDTKVRLLEEIIGLFNMSDVSTDGISMIPQYRSNIDFKKIRSDLFANFKSIHGIGNRMQKVQIVLKDGAALDTEEHEKLHNYLQQFNVYDNDYEIVSMTLNKYLTSGDEIVVGSNHGSFGCFAKSNDNDESIYGIFSKHVASTRKQETELYAKEDGEPKYIGSIMMDTVTCDGLDIAAAKLSIPKDQCDTRLKSADGKPKKSKRALSIQPERLRGRKVHMWGAKSKPGKGIITVPEYMCEGMDHTLIQVEDIADGEGTVEKRFAQPGDSGAIACTDDPCKEFVNPISMNMGCMNYTDIEEDEKQKVKKKMGKYLTIPLTSGLKEIGRRIGKNMEIC